MNQLEGNLDNSLDSKERYSNSISKQLDTYYNNNEFHEEEILSMNIISKTDLALLFKNVNESAVDYILENLKLTEVQISDAFETIDKIMVLMYIVQHLNINGVHLTILDFLTCFCAPKLGNAKAINSNPKPNTELTRKKYALSDKYLIDNLIKNFSNVKFLSPHKRARRSRRRGTKSYNRLVKMKEEINMRKMLEKLFSEQHDDIEDLVVDLVGEKFCRKVSEKEVEDSDFENNNLINNPVNIGQSLSGSHVDNKAKESGTEFEQLSSPGSQHDEYISQINLMKKESLTSIVQQHLGDTNSITQNVASSKLRGSKRK